MKNIIVDNNVRGKVTIYSNREVSPEEAYTIFLTVLEIIYKYTFTYLSNNIFKHNSSALLLPPHHSSHIIPSSSIINKKIIIIIMELIRGVSWPSSTFLVAIKCCFFLFIKEVN